MATDEALARIMVAQKTGTVGCSNFAAMHVGIQIANVEIA